MGLYSIAFLPQPTHLHRFKFIFNKTDYQSSSEVNYSLFQSIVMDYNGPESGPD